MKSVKQSQTAFSQRVQAQEKKQRKNRHFRQTGLA